MAKSDIDVAVIPSDSKLEIIDDNSFSHSSIKSIMIPSKIIRIGSNSFDFCSNLKSVEFSRNSKSRIIERGAFLSTSIDKFSIPSNVAIIGEAAFSQCNFLTKFIISKKSKLKMIECYAFNTTPVTSFFVPSKVSYICDFAFISTKLQIILIADKAMLKSINDRVFYDTPLKIIMVPVNLAVKFEITFNILIIIIVTQIFKIFFIHLLEIHYSISIIDYFFLKTRH